MRDGITLQQRLSLAGHKPRISPVLSCPICSSGYLLESCPPHNFLSYFSRSNSVHPWWEAYGAFHFSENYKILSFVTIFKFVSCNLVLCHFTLHNLFWFVRPAFWYINHQCHDDVIQWKHFPHYWPFVQGIHRSPVNSPHKGQLWCFLWSAPE